MRVQVNGEPRELAEGLTIAELVAEEASEVANGRGVAVAVDAQVIPRGDWAKTRLREGQRVELLAAMQGGGR
jgi:sulfur carrier protein